MNIEDFNESASDKIYQIRDLAQEKLQAVLKEAISSELEDNLDKLISILKG